MIRKKSLPIMFGAVLMLGLVSGCTQETQNRIGRSVQNWTGTDGVLDVFGQDKLVMRFVKVDQLSTGYGPREDILRPYRFGYGYADKNFNYKVDDGERKVYFEVSANATYVFYENFIE